MFQYAETVEQAAWNDEQQKKELEVRAMCMRPLPTPPTQRPPCSDV